MAKRKKESKNDEAQGIWNIIGYLAIAVIFISIITLGMKLTGFASSDVGEINLTVETSANINFSDALINFGSGQVNLGKANAVLESNSSASVNGNWSWDTADNLTLENLGNVNVSIDIKAGKTAGAFIGGTGSSYKYKVSNKEAGSCINATNYTLDVWYDVNTTSDGTEGTRVCEPLKFNTTTNSIYVDVRLVIPADSKHGILSDTLTATATAM